MEAFLATGVHPEVERARKAQQDIIPPIPERSTQRQHVFLDIAVGGQTRGGLRRVPLLPAARTSWAPCQCHRSQQANRCVVPPGLQVAW